MSEQFYGQITGMIEVEVLEWDDAAKRLYKTGKKEFVRAIDGQFRRGFVAGTIVNLSEYDGHTTVGSTIIPRVFSREELQEPKQVTVS